MDDECVRAAISSQNDTLRAQLEAATVRASEQAEYIKFLESDDAAGRLETELLEAEVVGLNNALAEVTAECDELRAKVEASQADIARIESLICRADGRRLPLCTDAVFEDVRNAQEVLRKLVDAINAANSKAKP